MYVSSLLRAAAAVVAAQATLGLADGDRFAPGQFDFVEILPPPLDRNQVELLARRIDRFGVGIEERIDLAGLAPEGVDAAGQILVDAHGRPLARGHGLDHRGRPAHGVAAGEDPFFRGLAGDRVDLDEIALPGLQRESVGNALQVERLPDGHEDMVGGNDEGVAALFGPAAAGAIELAQPHRLALDARHAAARRNDFHRRGQQFQRHAFVFGLFDLFLVGRHHVAAAAIDHGDRLGPQPHGRAGRVDGRVAAADDHDILAHRHGAAEIVRPQEATARR